jgi:hypothetical protein
MPSTRKAAARKPASSKKSKSSKPKRKTSAPAGPLVDVARKIGTTLGEVAVRAGIVKPGGSESSGQ